jgi:hypothetical protein
VGKVRRGGFVFVWWKGDHEPRHVHVYRDRRLVVKWDLDQRMAMKGRAPRKLVDLLAELEAEGLL